MTAQILDGRELARKVREQVKTEVEKLNKKPGLATVIIGDNKDSHTYVGIKEKMAGRVGFSSIKKAFPATFEPKKIVDEIQELNSNNDIHGIIIQLPLPETFERHLILKQVHPFKDVDALHPKNLGLLVEGHPVFLSPFTLGVIDLINAAGIYKTKTIDIGFYKNLELPNLKGTKIALIGNGLLVGRPLSIFFAQQHATVSVINTSTNNPSSILKDADIIITGTRGENVLSPNDVKDGAIVISGGNDIDDEKFSDRNIFLAPSIGGIGPLTVVYLLYNTLLVAKSSNPNANNTKL